MLTPNVVPDFTALRVAIVGDLIADHYLYARPTRLSREAPVIVMRYVGEEIGAGGASNVARNVWTFGAQTMLLGAIGRDANGRELVRLLEAEQVDVTGVASVPEWPTPTKTRILGAEPGRTMHQVLRIDRDPDAPLPLDVQKKLAEDVRSLAGRVDALLVSDYGYGVVSEELARAAREVRQAGGIVVLDPRKEFKLFRGATAMTPNLAELAAVTGRGLEDMVDQSVVTTAARELLEECEPEWLLVTMGNRGMALYSRDMPKGVTIRPAGSESVIDVSGAGDTAAAAFTLGLAAGLEGPRAMRLANAAAGVVVMEHGTAVCAISKLRSSLPEAPQPALSPAVVGG
ncbi:MAG: bifunctional hydroxymethylpyrimidine kinase/phosphomethylpyrimidine kinase [Deltaproteobacteria bacterium]|nr:bifunctional hydroxymethylpyrimidine kinase/phosphomethylpyrimidine kinase [Deltaproteobacteria bacterium]